MSGVSQIQEQNEQLLNLLQERLAAEDAKKL
jgi:hypothetical protein